MSWIESHQSLLAHRKTLRATAKLGVSKYLLIGHLHSLWWWALDNAEDNGSLGQALPEEISEAAGWPIKKADAFVTALVSVGFLDEDSAGYALHNWWRYAGKLNAKRSKDRERKAEGSVEVARNSSGIPTEFAANSQAPTYLPTNLPTNLTNQGESADAPPQPEKPKREAKRTLTEADIAELVDDHPQLNVNREAERFRDYVLAKKPKYVDEVAAFRNWLRRAEDDQRTKAPGGAVAGLSVADRFNARVAGR